MRYYLFVLSVAFLCCTASQSVAQSASDKDVVRGAISQICSAPNSAPVKGARRLDSDSRRARNGSTIKFATWALPNGQKLRVSNVTQQQRKLLFVDLYATKNGRDVALLRGVARNNCNIIGGRQVIYENVDGATQPVSVRGLRPDLTASEQVIPLNPKPPSGRYRDCTKVGLLDNGVNYQRNDIARRLSYDRSGKLIGADFWDRDSRPFDYGYPLRSLDPRQSIFNPRRHGSLVASVIIDYSPESICIVPARFSPVQSKQVVEAGKFFASQNVRIISLQVGRQKKWPEFLQTIDRHPDILFVAAAGNDGRDLRRSPSYPAAYSRPNLLVVAGANASLSGLWERSNYGAQIVEVAVVAEDVSLKRFDGSPASLSGTSFAAPKVSAYASMLMRAEPGLVGAELKQRIIRDAQASRVSVKGIPVLTEKAMRDLAAASAR